MHAPHPFLRLAAVGIAGIVLTILPSAGCNETLGDYIVIPGFAGFEISHVRVINVSADIGEVDVWNRQYPYFPDLATGDATDYTRMNDGVRTLAVVSSSATTDANPIVAADLKFPIDTYHTVVLAGTAGQYRLLRFDDDRTPPIADFVRFRVINALESGPSVGVFGAGDEPLAAEIGYTEATGSIEYGGALSEINIRRLDTDDVIFNAAPPPGVESEFLAGRNLTVIIYLRDNVITVAVLENNLAAK